MRFRFWKMFNFANAMHLVTLFLLASKNKYHSSDKRGIMQLSGKTLLNVLTKRKRNTKQECREVLRLPMLYPLLFLYCFFQWLFFGYILLIICYLREYQITFTRFCMQQSGSPFPANSFQIYETNRNEQQPNIPILCLFKNFFAFSAISGIFLIRNLFGPNWTGKEMSRFRKSGQSPGPNAVRGFRQFYI